MGADHAYAELGLAPGATEAEVKGAWRRLASEWHPDRNASAAAISRMQRINEALAQIRQQGFARDSAHPAANRSDAAPETAGADFDSEGGSSRRCRTISRKLRLTLEEAAAGCVKTLRGKWVDRCPACAGAGYRVLGGACADCQGAGSVRQWAWYGWSGEPVACAACAGDGQARQACQACAGSGKLPASSYRIDVRIPHGVRDADLLHVGQRLQRSGHCAVELTLSVELQPHALFQLAADGTIHCEVPVDGLLWIANRTIDVPTLTGLHKLRLSRDQLSYRLSGQGFPSQRRGPRADHLIQLHPLFAQQLGTDQEILLDQLVATSSGPGCPPPPPRLAAWRQALRAWEKADPQGGR